MSKDLVMFLFKGSKEYYGAIESINTGGYLEADRYHVENIFWGFKISRLNISEGGLRLDSNFECCLSIGWLAGDPKLIWALGALGSNSQRKY